MPEGNGGSFLCSIIFQSCSVEHSEPARASGFRASSRRVGSSFLGTLTVNVTGCFIIGIFAAPHRSDSRFLVSPGFRQFFMIGVCGGFTTFSSFGLQTLDLVRMATG